MEDILFTYPKAENVSEKEQQAFWQSLRKFYRTGELPKKDKTEKFKSIFSQLIKPESVYPFSEGDKSFDLNDQTVIDLLVHSLSHFEKARANDFKTKINELMVSLSKLLNVDLSTQADEEVYDFAADVIAFDKLKALSSQPEKVVLSETREKRLNEVLETLKKGLSEQAKKSAQVLIPKDKKLNISAEEIELIEVSKGQTFEETKLILKKQMGAFTELIRAFRIAHLEVDDAFDDSIHSDYFEHFNWYRLTEAEKELFHPSCLVIDHEHLEGHLDAFSKLLSTNWPIRILVLNSEAITEAQASTSWEDASHQNRWELSLFTLSHRNVCYHQSCIANPDSIHKAFNCGLPSKKPAVWQVLIPKEGSSSIRQARAAAMSKYFPVISYEPSRDKGAGFELSLVDTSENPWHELQASFKTKESTKEQVISFTYADYKALDQSKADELMKVPEGFVNEHLVPLAEYLNYSEEQLIGKIPFIWMCDDQNELIKAAVPNNWVVSCQERMNFWRYLRSLAHVESVVKEAVSPNEEIEALKEQHALELEKVKQEAAGETVNKILAELLGTR